jgi:hypothetical protein
MMEQTNESPTSDLNQSEPKASTSAKFTKYLLIKMYFFCDQPGTRQQPLHKVATDNAREILRKAVNSGNNDIFLVKLSTAIKPMNTNENQ